MDRIFCLLLIHATVSPSAFKGLFLLHGRVSLLSCNIAICSSLVEGFFVLNSFFLARRLSTGQPSCKDYCYKTAIARRKTKILI